VSRQSVKDKVYDAIIDIFSRSHGKHPMAASDIVKQLKNEYKMSCVTIAKVKYRLNLLLSEGKINGQNVGNSVWIYWKKRARRKKSE